MKTNNSDTISLREYIDFKIEHESELREAWKEMHDKMVTMAKEYVDEKLDKMNEMREQINKERSQLLNRAEYLPEQRAIETRVNTIEKISSNYQGRLAVLGGIWGLIVILVSHFWK